MKLKITAEKTVKYLRELSVVVVGITITFGINNWINSKKEAKDLDLYMSAAKLELEKNLERVNITKEFYYEQAVLYSSYLKANNMQNLHPDTLKRYIYLNYNLPFFAYETSAFEMFKTSGMMRLIRNKNKMQAIWNCYTQLEGLRIISDFYIQRKTAELDKLNVYTQMDTNEEQKLLFGFMTNGLADNILTEFNKCSTKIGQTLSEF